LTMATQATNRHAELMIERQRKAGMLLESLYAMALDPNEAAQTRATAAKTYLSKTLPDLKAIEHSGGMDLQVTAIELRVVDPQS
jgi:hypothetical protein